MTAAQRAQAQGLEASIAVLKMRLQRAVEDRYIIAAEGLRINLRDAIARQKAMLAELAEEDAR